MSAYRDEKDPTIEPKQLFAEHREHLLLSAYQMLGRWSEAEDVVQDAFIRWIRICETEQGRANIRHSKAYLTTIVSRLCLEFLRRAHVRRETYTGAWIPEPLPHQSSFLLRPLESLDTIERSEELTTAFLLILERMSPVERVVFLMREVFDCEYENIADVVHQNPTYCRQIFKRAKQRVQRDKPRFSSTQEQQQEVLIRFMEACSTHDYEQLVSILAPDVVMLSDSDGKVSAARRPVYTSSKVARFILGIQNKLPEDCSFSVLWHNGHPGFLCTSEGRPYSVLTLELGPNGIQHIYIQRNPDKMKHLAAL